MIEFKFGDIVEHKRNLAFHSREMKGRIALVTQVKTDENGETSLSIVYKDNLFPSLHPASEFTLHNQHDIGQSQ